MPIHLRVKGFVKASQPVLVIFASTNSMSGRLKKLRDLRRKPKKEKGNQREKSCRFENIRRAKFLFWME